MWSQSQNRVELRRVADQGRHPLESTVGEIRMNSGRRPPSVRDIVIKQKRTEQLLAVLSLIYLQTDYLTFTN